MSIDYKLHKVTEQKVDEIVDMRKDVERREGNIKTKEKEVKEAEAKNEREQEDLQLEIDKLLQEKDKLTRQELKDSKALGKLEKQYKGEIRDLKKKTSKAMVVNKRYKAALKLTRESEKELKKKVENLDTLEQQAQEDAGTAKRLRKESQGLYMKADKKHKVAEGKKQKAETLLARAKIKDKEANGLKISLGIERKGLETIRKDLKEQRSWVGQRTAELQVSAREVRLKRKLLSKAYSLADLDELDTKVIQEIGW